MKGLTHPARAHLQRATDLAKNLQIEKTFFNLQETFVTIAP